MTTPLLRISRPSLVALLALSWFQVSGVASSHMDAPLITLDDAANTTDVYAFVSGSGGKKTLTTALSVFPFEEPGIGPNAYRFDENVLYEIHVSTGSNVGLGRPTYSYQFQFFNVVKNRNTILQSYLGTIENVNDAAQNFTQGYVVHRVDRFGVSSYLGAGVVPPNNQGRVTPHYNQMLDGEMRAQEGVSDEGALDRYTRQSIANLSNGYRAFAGQRDDGFYADIQSIFDLDFTFSGENKPFDSQGGFNVHTIVLDIPLEEIGGDAQVAGVYATTSRRRITVLSPSLLPKILGGSPRLANAAFSTIRTGPWVQIGRQGNPLFNEALVAIEDKDLFNRSSPADDHALFSKYALQPELAAVLGVPESRRTGRTDLTGIFIPDLIRVDLSTSPARLAGNPDDEGFHRLGIFGGDTLVSSVQTGFGGGVVPGGWPNGRRFGDDVVDIAVIAVLSDLRTSPPMIFGDSSVDIDGVNDNDITYNKVMPYAATPLNGRNHPHH
jgi:hypothetical protein